MAEKHILRQIETPYIDAQNLLALLDNYERPRDWIQRRVKNGELIRLRNGFYLIAEHIQKGANRIIPYEQVANLLYGPSYVSLEWALSFYGMIPERVHTVTSMTLGREKVYATPVGNFSYFPLRRERYYIGVEQKKAVGFIGEFFMASPEKALADFVYVTCRGVKQEELATELLESKRINEDVLRTLDRALLAEIGRCYRSTTVNYLINLLGVL